MNKLKSREDFQKLLKELEIPKKNKTILALCSSTSCRACNSEKLYAEFVAELEKQKLTARVSLKRNGCHGFCEQGPILVIQPAEICYLKVQPKDVAKIIQKTVLKGELIKSLLWHENGRSLVRADDIPFYKYQTRYVLANNVRIDQTDINDYIHYGGYSALLKALFELSPQQVLQEIKLADLRGRGGGGFPAGIKWETTRNSPDPVKYVVVNGDEGDPGAYMDSSLLEGTPHSVLEGLLIGAYAIGAQKGFFYIRQEYPLALKNTRIAIAQAEDLGLLGDNILGSDFSFRVKVHQGAGAFVSGESSALLSAIEGKVGEPRLKYIRMSVSGLWGKPTNLNNVETWANVPLIINKGANWFRTIGTEHSKGTKIFSLVGKINNTGLVEVPMGMTLREIIFKIGGGIKNNKKFKAVQTGGPSGGCIPEKYLDTPVDFDELTSLGSMMGSGGMIVMDETSCMVDIADYYMKFLKEESCGKCIPCREGISAMVAILNRIKQGYGREGDIEMLEDIGVLLSETSLCGLGLSAANPVLSTLRYFRKEYETHIREKRCEALVCKDLILYTIDPALCTGCQLCLKQCPVQAITGEKKKLHQIIQKDCIKCGICLETCPVKFHAVAKTSPGRPGTGLAAGGGNNE